MKPLKVSEVRTIAELPFVAAAAYGDRFGATPGGLSLAALKAQPHGIDLGPLQPRIPEVLRTRSGRIELCPEPIVAQLSHLADEPTPGPDEFVVVGRRHLRSNNSWMHNIPSLVKGRELCTLVVNRSDAARIGLADGGRARVTSRVGQVELTVEVTDDIAPGVVSIPHGWGHDAPGTRLSIAATKPGTNSNMLADEDVVEPVSGNAVLNGIPVEVAPC